MQHKGDSPLQGDFQMIHRWLRDVAIPGRCFRWSHVLALLLTVGPMSHAQVSMQDAKVIAAYPLTMDKVQKKYEATIEITQISASDSGFHAQLEKIANQPTLDTQIRSIEALPQAAKIIQKHGLSVRDYALTTMALNTAMIPQAPEGLRSKQIEPDPLQIAASPEHVRFLQDHREEIHKMLSQVYAASKAGTSAHH
jgi:hypothetical protein